MTPTDLANNLTGMEYPLRLSRAIKQSAKDAGLVIVYGASDDRIEFEGAIYDELGAWDGRVVHLCAKDVLVKPDEESDLEYIQYWDEYKGRTKPIAVSWDKGEYTWEYKTDIPHATFEIIDEGNKYCLGMVISLQDLG